MIKTIAHLADIHTRKTPTRNEEYQQVFKRLITSLKKEKPDRIVIVGDLVHDYLDLQGEQLIMAHNLLRDLAAIAPVRITRGNHDCRKKNLKRVDSIKAIVETLGNVDVIYYNILFYRFTMIFALIAVGNIAPNIKMFGPMGPRIEFFSVVRSEPS